jgi:hypothetical protein
MSRSVKESSYSICFILETSCMYCCSPLEGDIASIMLHTRTCDSMEIIKSRYVCFACDYHSDHHGHMKRHILSLHLCGKRMKCPQCMCYFKNRNSLAKHLKQKHDSKLCKSVGIESEFTVNKKKY